MTQSFYSLLDSFSTFSRLNVSEIAGIGVLKSVNFAFCGMKNISLIKKTIKILDVHISYNKNLQCNQNFSNSIKNIVNVIRLQHMRNLTIEGKITIFKWLVITQISYLALLTRIPNFVFGQMKQIQKRFYRETKNTNPCLIRNVTNIKMVVQKMMT